MMMNRELHISEGERNRKSEREREFPKIMKFESFYLVKALADPPIQFPNEI